MFRLWSDLGSVTVVGLPMTIFDWSAVEREPIERALSRKYIAEAYRAYRQAAARIPFPAIVRRGGIYYATGANTKGESGTQ